MTKYVVLRVLEAADGRRFETVGTVEAGYPAKAVRLLVGDDARAARYLVIPARNSTLIEHGTEPQPPKTVTKLVEPGRLFDSLPAPRSPAEAAVRSPAEVIDGEDGA